MRDVNRIVAIRADEQEIRHVACRGEAREEIEGWDVAPLEVIKEHHERMLRGGEDSYEIQKDDLKSVLRFSGRQVG
ncbi:MAG TPA: hypothetical protein VIJ16_01140, partial [Gemmatimonadaceae bacterium]